MDWPGLDQTIQWSRTAEPNSEATLCSSTERGSSRLATMVKKDRGDAPIVKIKPGVFGLREFSSDVLEAAKDDSGHDFKLADLKEPEAKDEDSGSEPASEEDAASVD